MNLLARILKGRACKNSAPCYKGIAEAHLWIRDGPEGGVECGEIQGGLLSDGDCKGYRFLFTV